MFVPVIKAIFSSVSIKERIFPIACSLLLLIRFAHPLLFLFNQYFYFRAFCFDHF
ncbi:hypothetical protein CHCC15325_3083 [Bacillus licheniformis]|nr:hypothetical protein CHCC15325_3083 [Bacillus licheniformis]